MLSSHMCPDDSIVKVMQSFCLTAGQPNTADICMKAETLLDWEAMLYGFPVHRAQMNNVRPMGSQLKQ